MHTSKCKNFIEIFKEHPVLGNKIFFSYIKLKVQVRNPIDSPTARESDSLIGNIYVMCVGFLNFIYFLANSRTIH